MMIERDEEQPMASASEQQELQALEARINAILPPRYVGCFENVPAGSMGSASLKYDKQGRVAWGAVWTTFCHLALAGGPPHRGRLLDAVPVAEALAQPDEQAAVVAEIKRAMRLCVDLEASDDAPPGWVGVQCEDNDMAAWLVRAIVAENVIARHEGALLLVPAGPQFRVEKEIKSVVVSLAKTCHYLLGHVDSDARPRGFPPNLIEPPLPELIAGDVEQHRAAREVLREGLAGLGVEAADGDSLGWIGIPCSSEEMAVWMQRAIVVENVLARREHDVVFVPVGRDDREVDPSAKTLQVVEAALGYWLLRTAVQQNGMNGAKS